MKQLVITGLSQETNFEGTSGAKIFLVINNGEARIPTDEKGAEDLLKLVYEGGENHTASNGAAEEPENDPLPPPDDLGAQDEDEVPQI